MRWGGAAGAWREQRYTDDAETIDRGQRWTASKHAEGEEEEEEEEGDCEKETRKAWEGGTMRNL